jgi:simple sugar transport system ATP-binding protein
LTLHQGEVVGLAGLEASGQEVFLRLGAGLIPPTTGTVRLQGTSMTGRDHHGFQSAGTLFLPTSRLEEGLIPGLDITEHFALQDHRRSFWVQWDRAAKTARSRIDRFRIKGRPQTLVDALSGGNQQRLLLSFIPKEATVLLLENPTRGLDLESANWVWQHLHDLCRKGACIAFSSAELDEILMVADRVLVFFEGRIIKDVGTDETDIQALGRAVAGGI